MKKARCEIFGQQRRADDLVLDQFATCLRQKDLLLPGLNAVGNDGEVHAVPQRDDGMHNGSIMAVTAGSSMLTRSEDDEECNMVQFYTPFSEVSPNTPFFSSILILLS